MSDLEGLLNIDKPSGLTSHDVVKRIRQLSGIRRIGHTGTLDPLATGVIVICIGRATRLAEYVVGLQKSYIVDIRLGQETDTYDVEGTVVAQHPVSVKKTDLKSALEQFQGEIRQIPPMYSAIKVGGQPLYKRARKGEKIEPKERTVTIKRIELRSWLPPMAQLQIECSSGTYIRSLAHDLGKLLGCGGTVMTLRRTAVGRFEVNEAVPLMRLNEENWADYLLSSDNAVNHLKEVMLEIDAATALYHGKKITAVSGLETGEQLRAYDTNGQFVGILMANDAELLPKKIFYRPVEG